jgi:hypothetical protein
MPSGSSPARAPTRSIPVTHDLTVEHRPVKLLTQVEEGVHALLDRLRLAFGVLDFRVSASGDYYFLEVHPSGQFAYLEALTGVPLFSRLAAFLADRPPTGPGLEAAGLGTDRQATEQAKRRNTLRGPHRSPA